MYILKIDMVKMDSVSLLQHLPVGNSVKSTGNGNALGNTFIQTPSC